MRLGHPLQQVPRKVHAATLPAAALQHPADGVGKALVGIADHQLDASEAALLERSDEVAPERLALAVAHLEAEQFPAPIGVHAHGDDDSSGADLHRPAQPAVQAGQPKSLSW
jgi:hypothetical protein